MELCQDQNAHSSLSLLLICLTAIHVSNSDPSYKLLTKTGQHVSKTYM